MKPQLPNAQKIDALDRGGQVIPHMLQLLMSVWVLISQPLSGFPSQSAKPGSQAKPQLPDAHVVVALGTTGQTIPHIPQLAVSVRVFDSHPSAMLLLQSSNGGVQV